MLMSQVVFFLFLFVTFVSTFAANDVVWRYGSERKKVLPPVTRRVTPLLLKPTRRYFRNTTHTTTTARTTTSTTTEAPKNRSMYKVYNPRDEVLFESQYFTVETAQLGSMATLHCDILNTTNVTVVWRKKELGDLTKNNDTVYKYDKRYIATNMTKPNDWTLRVMYTKWDNKGLYECEVTRNMSKYGLLYRSSIFVELRLIDGWAQIIGDSPITVKEGSPLRLMCALNNVTAEAPKYIFWYKGNFDVFDQVINYLLADGANVRKGRQGSELIFPSAQLSHAGNYSCVPSNARQASIIVNVEEKQDSKQDY